MDYTTYTVHTHSHATHRAAAAGAAEAEHPERPGERRAKGGQESRKTPNRAVVELGPGPAEEEKGFGGSGGLSKHLCCMDQEERTGELKRKRSKSVQGKGRTTSASGATEELLLQHSDQKCRKGERNNLGRPARGKAESRISFESTGELNFRKCPGSPNNNTTATIPTAERGGGRAV